jgi:hypothetical protein
MHINIRNGGRQPVTIAQITVYSGRLPGLGPLMRLARFSRFRKVIGRAAGLNEIGEPLSYYLDHLVLNPNDYKEYSLEAEGYSEDRSTPPRFTYVCVAEISSKMVAKQVRVDGHVKSWKDD